MSQIWQVGTLHTGSYVFIILWTLIYFLAQDILSSSSIYPTLKSALSPRSPISFKWRIIFRNQDLVYSRRIHCSWGIKRKCGSFSVPPVFLVQALFQRELLSTDWFLSLVSFLCIFIISSPSPHNYVCSGQFPVFA